MKRRWIAGPNVVLNGSAKWSVRVGEAGNLILPDHSVDLVITDPPYDSHTHGKQRRGCTGYVERPGQAQPQKAQFNRSRELGFVSMTPELMLASAMEMARVVKRWVLIFCSLEMVSDWKRELEAVGLDYVRTCVWVKMGCAPQFTGDRPAQGAEAIVVAHPPGRKVWNSRGKRGVYTHSIVLNRGGNNPRLHTTQKPINLMRELVSDFAKPGEVILDEFAGSSTTGEAALGHGCRYIGVEMDPKYVFTSRARLSNWIGR